MPSYNRRSPAVRRILQEVRELAEPTDQYSAAPLEDNIFEWHFSIRGPPGSDFEGGRYHGRISLPNDYPMKPPSIMMLTANGRFEVGRKICLSVSDFHPESWRPSWSIRTVLVALIGFMPTPGNGAIAALDYTPQERKALAEKRYDRSRTWRCPDCDVTSETCLAEGVAAPEMSSEDREALQELSFKGEKTKSRNASECATPAEEVASGGEGGPMEEATAGKAQAEATQAETAQAGGAATGDAPQPAARRAVPAQAAAPPATPRRPAETIQMQPAKVDWMFNCFVGALVAAILALMLRKMNNEN